MSLTGILLAFEPQFAAFSERELRYVTPPTPHTPPLSVETLLARARAARPGPPVTAVILRSDPTASVVVQLGRDGGASLCGTVLGGPSGLHEVMHAIVEWHRWLGSRERARWITGACNLSFMGLALTGLYLWWPRTRAALRGAVLARVVTRRHRGWTWWRRAPARRSRAGRP